MRTIDELTDEEWTQIEKLEGKALADYLNTLGLDPEEISEFLKSQSGEL
jgi:hypothetical protein